MFNSKKENNRNSLVLSAVYFSTLTAIVILIAKVWAWYLTRSSTVLASFLDSLLDIVASFVNYVAARYARRPPDNEHRFGHSRAEDLAVFVQAFLFGISGVVIIIKSIEHMMSPRVIEREGVAIWLMLFSIVLTVVLVIYQQYVYKKTKSNIVKCDSLHYSVDLLTNIFVILALYLSSKFQLSIVDSIFALFIGLYMIYGSVRLLQGVFRNLMDHEFYDKEKNKLHDIIMSHKEVNGYHDLKTRHAGSKSFIQLHLELDGRMSLTRAHVITEEVENMIRKEYEDAEIIIHQDPKGIKEPTQFHD